MRRLDASSRYYAAIAAQTQRDRERGIQQGYVRGLQPPGWNQVVIMVGRRIGDLTIVRYKRYERVGCPTPGAEWLRIRDISSESRWEGWCIRIPGYFKEPWE